MNVYVLGTGKHGAIAGGHRSVLRSRLAAVWGPIDVQFHGEETAAFTPDDCAALLIAGGSLPATPENMTDVLRYTTAMHWFSDSLAGVALGAPGDFSSESWQRYIPALGNLRILTVRDEESGRILRQTGLRCPVLTCADLAYLLPVVPHVKDKEVKRPMLGVFAERANTEIAEVVHDLKTDFEVRYVSPADFSDVDVCLTTQLQGVIHSVLHEIPFAVIQGQRETVSRECKAIGYPAISDIRSAWSERVALQELLRKVKPRRVRHARRNIELISTALRGAASDKAVSLENGRETLVVWAAPDEYWDEANGLLASIGPGFDCLVPATCRVSPAGARKRLSIPAGALMHWAMLPEDLKRQIESRYENVVVCHAFNASNGGNHLADIAARTGGRGWEFRLWTHSCASYS